MSKTSDKMVDHHVPYMQLSTQQKYQKPEPHARPGKQYQMIELHPKWKIQVQLQATKTLINQVFDNPQSLYILFSKN